MQKRHAIRITADDIDTYLELEKKHSWVKVCLRTEIWPEIPHAHIELSNNGCTHYNLSARVPHTHAPIDHTKPRTRICNSVDIFIQARR